MFQTTNRPCNANSIPVAILKKKTAFQQLPTLQKLPEAVQQLVSKEISLERALPGLKREWQPICHINIENGIRRC